MVRFPLKAPPPNRHVVKLHGYEKAANQRERAERRRDLLRWAGYGSVAAVAGFGATWLALRPPDMSSIRPAVSSGSIARGVYHPNCDAARAAGAAPLYRGQPGYRQGLDADNDGIACEPLPRRRW
jgi:hypothetical protein